MPLVLVVEDNALLAAAERRALERAGFEVSVAGDCAAALRAWGSRRPDLVIQDLMLPDGNGIDLLAQLRKLPGGAEVPILATSGFLSMEDALLPDAGFDDFVPKPVSPSLLVQIVQAHLPPPPDKGLEAFGRGRRVLVADDDAVQLKLTRARLARLGFEVVTASDGNEALALARAALPHAVLAKVVLPQLDGFGLTEALRDDPSTRRVPVVLVTASQVDAADRHLALSLGATDLVVRSGGHEELARVLRAALERPEARPTMPPPATESEPERAARVLQQYERQLAINGAIAQRYATLSAELAVLTGISDAVMRKRDLESALDDVLTACFDASGIAVGALYLLGKGGDLSVRSLAGKLDKALFEDFFGRPELLRSVIASGRAQCLTGNAPGARAVLDATGSSWAMVVPLVYGDEPLGALLMLSASRALDTADWLAFAQGVGNQITQALVMARAFEERNLSEARSREQATMLQTVLDAIVDAVVVCDPRGQLLAWNRATTALAAARLFERPLEQDPAEIGMFQLDQRTPFRLDERPLVRALRGEHASAEFFLKNAALPEGRYFTCFARPLTLADHGACAVAVFHDVTDRQRYAQEILASRAAWQALVESAPDEIIRVDRNGIVEFTNRAITDPARAAIVGKPWLELAPADYHPVMRAAMETALERGQPASFESAVPLPDGAMLWSLTQVGPIREVDRIAGAILIVRDITQRKATEAQLIVADRMASVGTLAAGVAHEINNPLAAVIANLDLAIREAADLAERGGVDHELEEELVDARDSAERVRQIVRDLKLFSRSQDERRGPVNVERVLESTIRIAWNEIRHRARLVKDYAPVPLVEANDSRLGQVFLNLLVNAAQAIPEGRAEANQIRLVTRLVDNRVMIEVSDTGVGIPPEVMRRLYTPFFTTKPAGVGTGLGLSICQRIITALGGEITVASEMGKGTTFRVFLPPSKSSVVQPVVPRAVNAALRRGRVLVIDDEPTIGVAVRRMLASEHDVTTVTSGAQALDRFGAGERFDVVLCDLMMPQITGMDVYEELRRVWPEQAQKVIFLTGGAFTPRARKFLEDVPNLRLEKPFEAQQLRSLINDRVK